LQEKNDPGLEVLELCSLSIFLKDNKRNEASKKINYFSQRCGTCCCCSFTLLSAK